jgi:hypothetical protein
LGIFADGFAGEILRGWGMEGREPGLGEKGFWGMESGTNICNCVYVIKFYINWENGQRW